MTIVITQPHFFDGEAARIEQLFRRDDVDLVHIRKPQSRPDDVERLLCQLPPSLYARLVLHDHHPLAAVYHLRGIHLNSRHPQPLPGWTGAVSRSCHSLDELAACRREPYDYFCLSPIFDSISKPGYRSAFTPAQLAEARRQGVIDHRVMALGGVTFSRVEQVLQMGFGGAMILGDAWT